MCVFVCLCVCVCTCAYVHGWVHACVCVRAVVLASNVPTKLCGHVYSWCTCVTLSVIFSV